MTSGDLILQQVKHVVDNNVIGSVALWPTGQRDSALPFFSASNVGNEIVVSFDVFDLGVLWPLSASHSLAHNPSRRT